MVSKEHLLVPLLFVGLMVYIVIGGAVFHAIEYPREQQDAQQAVTALTDFLGTHQCVNLSELTTFLGNIDYLISVGSVTNTTQASMWTFGGAFTFAATIVTTIGYGAITPSAAASQAFCVCYGMLGIPLCLLLLSKIGAIIAKVNRTLVGKLVKWPEGDKKRTLLGFFLLFCIGFTLMCLIPCISFAYIEGWSYSTAMYFTMVTLSTVGFGDYVLAESANLAAGMYRVLICVWVFWGLAWFASLITVIQEGITANVDKITAVDEAEEKKTEEPPAVETVKGIEKQ